MPDSKPLQSDRRSVFSAASAYLCGLCVERPINAEIRRDTQRAAEERLPPQLDFCAQPLPSRTGL